MMGTLQGRDILSITDLGTEEIRDLLTLAVKLKTGKSPQPVI